MRPPESDARTLLIFDCDGVLFDSEMIANATLAELITSLGHPMSTEDSIRVFTGRSLKDVLAVAAELIGREIPPHTSAHYGERLFARFRNELRPVTGVREAIAALPYSRCVASSSHPDRLRLSLEVTGLAPLFGAHVYSATQVARGKPAPDLFWFAAESVGHAPADCIVIEDSPRGIEAARLAGMRAVGFVGASHAGPELADVLSEAGAHRVIRGMDELPATLAALRLSASA
jgi:HAD superfamily hydrolase (TIGR01509 family)